MSESVHAELPRMTRQQVLERAQRILDLRGRPPYTARHGDNDAFEPELSDDEAAVLSEFVQYWLPFLVEKPR